MRGFPRLVIAQAVLLRRNVGYWIPTLGLAVISMMVFGWLFEVGTQAFVLGIVDEDGSEASRALVQVFDGLESVELEKGSRSHEMSALDDGNRAAVVLIPQGFQTALAKGQSTLDVRYDISNPVRAAYASATVAAVVDGFNTAMAGERGPVVIQRQDVGTHRVDYIDFLTPGMAGLTLFWGALFGGIVFLAGWRELGILRRLGVTPLRPAALIASQGASLALLSFVQVAIVFLVGRFAFGVTIEGSYLLLAVTLFLGIACMLALGYIIGSFLHTLASAAAVANLVSFPMMFLSGAWFSLDSAPDFLQPVVRAIPLTHLNEALRAIVNRGDGVGDVWWNWVVLAAWGAAGYFISVRVFRWE